MKARLVELVVLECIGLVKDCYAEVADNADAIRQKWEGIGKYVKKHFGVKE